ncbi:MAG: two-component sensor histidine kinase, partial [Methylocella sp.]
MTFAQYAGLCAGTCTLLLTASPELGEAADQTGLAASLRGHAGAAGLSLIAGLIAFLVLAALLYLSGRRRWLEHEATHDLELSALRAKLDRAELFLGAETQIIVAWGGPGEDPDIEGNLRLAGDQSNPRRVLAFGSWLPPATAQTLDNSVARLRARG